MAEILLGVRRPIWVEFIRPIQGSVLCRCGEMCQTLQAIHYHWAMGHFDEPVHGEAPGEDRIAGLERRIEALEKVLEANAAGSIISRGDRT